MGNSKNLKVEKMDFMSSILLRGNLKSACAVVLYCFSSVAIVVVNKTLLTTYGFDYPFFIMASQMIFTILLLETLNIMGIISVPAYSFERAKEFAFASFFYGLNSVLALSALNHMNIALYGVLKRCVPVVTMLLSVVILGKGWPSRNTVVSILLLTSGCIIAGYGDLSFNLYGYVCGASSNITQAVYLLLVQRSIRGTLSTVESLQLNSYNTVPFFAIICILNGEVSHIQQFLGFKDISFIVIFLSTISLGCLLNYSLFLCTHLTCALTTSVVGGVKAIVQTVIGLFTFGGVSRNLATVVGLSTSICGGIGYICAKYNENLGKDSKSLTIEVDAKSVPLSNDHLQNSDVVNADCEVKIDVNDNQKE